VKKDKKFFQGHERLAEERARIWGTQQEAADFFGVSRVTWGQYERGNATPTGDVLAGLVQQGADVLYILTGERSRPVPSKYNHPPEGLTVSAITPLDTDEAELLAWYRESDPAIRRTFKAALGAAAPLARHQVTAVSAPGRRKRAA